jgi:hypothetical protein
MKIRHLAIAGGTFLALCVGTVIAADAIQSGPQVGENARPKPFFPLNINGASAGKKACQVCRNGDNPAVMIFAREPSLMLNNLIKKVDAETVKNKSNKMGSFAVFCNDAESLEKQLKELAEKEKLQEFVLTIDNPTGPEPYKVAKDADVTVVLYNKSKVIANYAFKKGELSEKAIEKIMADVPKILEK